MAAQIENKSKFIRDYLDTHGDHPWSEVEAELGPKGFKSNDYNVIKSAWKKKKGLGKKGSKKPGPAKGKGGRPKATRTATASVNGESVMVSDTDLLDFINAEDFDLEAADAAANEAVEKAARQKAVVERVKALRDRLV